jgi:uncharacterized phage protein (TIGR02220 family)
MSNDNWPWFRLYVDWLSHPKVQRLSETDQRRFVCLMCMQSAGRLRRASVGDIGFELRISDQEAEETIARLKVAKLLDKDGSIHNWDDRQPKRDHSAERTAKYRARKKLEIAGATSQERCCDAEVTRCDGHGDTVEEIRGEEIRKEKRIPPNPHGGQVTEVVEYLNQVTGKQHSTTKAIEAIEKQLRSGATVQDCRDVIDHCWRMWHDDPKMVKFVNKVTPFRPSHFDAYLDEWRAGAAQTGKDAAPAKIQMTEKDKARMARIEAIAEEGRKRWEAENG